jgi:hypothetical protein
MRFGQMQSGVDKDVHALLRAPEQREPQRVRDRAAFGVDGEELAIGLVRDDTLVQLRPEVERVLA